MNYAGPRGLMVLALWGKCTRRWNTHVIIESCFYSNLTQNPTNVVTQISGIMGTKVTINPLTTETNWPP